MDNPTDEAERKKTLDNLHYNKKRWGNRENWEQKDTYGYNWSQMHEQPRHGTVSRIANVHLLPYLEGRSDLVTLEVAPGAGRFTTELIRVSSEIFLLDLNVECINICKERFKYYSHVKYFVNDGISCEMIPDNTFDLIASYDSFVHIEPAIIKTYLTQFKEKLLPKGIIWLHHSAKGYNPASHRTAMTDVMMKQFAEELELELLSQHYFDYCKDCVSILRKNP